MPVKHTPGRSSSPACNAAFLIPSSTEALYGCEPVSTCGFSHMVQPFLWRLHRASLVLWELLWQGLVPCLILRTFIVCFCGTEAGLPPLPEALSRSLHDFCPVLDSKGAGWLFLMAMDLPPLLASAHLGSKWTPTAPAPVVRGPWLGAVRCPFPRPKTENILGLEPAVFGAGAEADSCTWPVLGPLPAQAASSALRAFASPQASHFRGRRPQARGPGLSSRYRPGGPWACWSTPSALCSPWAACAWQEAENIAWAQDTGSDPGQTQSSRYGLRLGRLLCGKHKGEQGSVWVRAEKVRG